MYSLKAAQEAGAECVHGVLIAVAEVDEHDHRDHQHAALEAAAGGKVAVQDDVEDVNQRQRQDLVAAAALYNALYGALFAVIHSFLPPFPIF